MQSHSRRWSKFHRCHIPEVVDDGALRVHPVAISYNIAPRLRAKALERIRLSTVGPVHEAWKIHLVPMGGVVRGATTTMLAL